MKDKPQVAAVYLFGSYGTEFQLPSSDIDLGIVFCDVPNLKDELELDAGISSFRAVVANFFSLFCCILSVVIFNIA